MIGNALKVSWRNLLRQRGYSLLNILGLALGLAAALLVFGYLVIDLTWDRWHDHTDRVVRLVELQDFGGDERTDVAYTMAPLGPMLVEEIPEFESFTRVMSGYNEPVFGRGETRLFQSVHYVDSTFFQIFSFDLLRGDRDEVLSRRDAVVLTETAAGQYFAEGVDPVGQVLRVNNERDVVVTGIAADPPVNTHLQFEALLPFEVITEDQQINVDDFGSNSMATFLLLVEGASRAGLDEKVTEAYHRHGTWAGLEFYVQPLAEMHLGSDHIEIDINPGKRNMEAVYTLGAIGLFILLLACINYMNLATARSLSRAREVGLRKVVGARKRELIIQFLGESVLTALIAMLLAALFVELLSPSFSEVSGRELEMDVFGGGPASAVLFGLTLVVGLLAGLYPAFVLSSFRPSTVLKSQDARMVGGGRLRRALVVFQFAISIGLLIATGVVYTQLQYSQNKPLGFNKEQVLVLPVTHPEFWEKRQENVDAFSRITGVRRVATSSRVPARGGSSSGFTPEGSDRSRVMNWNSVDDGGREVFGWEMAEGRFFEPDRPGDVIQPDDSTGMMVVNEAAVEQFGWDEPLGRQVIGWGDMPFTVVGVVKNYHYYSLHWEIQPMLYINWPGSRYYLSMRFDRADAQALVEDVREVWEQRYPDRPFEYFFLDEQFDRVFRGEQRQAGLLQVFSLVAVFIACLGILGLAAYATGRRTREIAVRKVLGAGEGRILGLLTREFALLVLLANLIAWPAAYWAMDRWFENFAYRADWPWWVFPAAGLATLAVALLVVAVQAMKAVRLRPGAALRHE